MSYILQALKKSEQERQQLQNPALFSVYSNSYNEVSPQRWKTLLLTVSTAAITLICGWYIINQLFFSVKSDVPVALIEERYVEPPEATTSLDSPKPVTNDEPVLSEINIPVEQSLPLVPYTQLPDTVRNNIPAMTFSFHVYSDNPASRTIIINGVRYKEGGQVSIDIRLQEITKSGVILDYQGEYLYSMDIISAW